MSDINPATMEFDAPLPFGGDAYLVVTVEGTVSWTPATESPHPDAVDPAGHFYAGGWLFGPHALVRRVENVLATTNGAVWLSPDVCYRFSGPFRIGPPDVLAAMLVAMPTGRASDALLDELSMYLLDPEIDLEDLFPGEPDIEQNRDDFLPDREREGARSAWRTPRRSSRRSRR